MEVIALILIVLAAVYALGLVVLLLKGNSKQIANGVLFAPIWIVSAFRVAEPNSWWARHFYDDLQMEQARVRSEFRNQPEEPLLEPGGSSYGFEPDALSELPEGAMRCKLCDRVLPTAEDARRHAENLHTEVAFVDAEAALVPVGASVGSSRSTDQPNDG